MPELSTLLLFLPVSVALTLAPGPDIVFLVTQASSRGPKAGLATALGLAAGNLVHTLAAVLGISVIFQTSELAFEGLKVAGALYLLYLAWQALRHRKEGVGLSHAEEAAGAALFMRGVLMNVLNPKVALFFLAFLPQFVNPAAGPVWSQMLVLGVIFTLQVVVVFGVIGLAAGVIRQRLVAGRMGVLTCLSPYLVAGIFIALALRLLLLSR
ncbi:MAG: LysE family translocator [Gammaproteobacteria bacterium]|nr:LysE family translocator [Gammaproteobacteria bacterium]